MRSRLLVVTNLYNETIIAEDHYSKNYPMYVASTLELKQKKYIENKNKNRQGNVV